MLPRRALTRIGLNACGCATFFSVPWSSFQSRIAGWLITSAGSHATMSEWSSNTHISTLGELVTLHGQKLKQYFLFSPGMGWWKVQAESVLFEQGPIFQILFFVTVGFFLTHFSLKILILSVLFCANLFKTENMKVSWGFETTEEPEGHFRKKKQK